MTDGSPFGAQHSPAKDRLNGIVLVPAPTRELLNERQHIDYRQHREQLVRWMLNLGKSPEAAEGYAYDVAERRAHDCDAFYRWVWEQCTDGYTTAVTREQADKYIQSLIYDDYSQSHLSNVQKSLKMLFRWRDDSEKWQPDHSFTTSESATPREYLTREERQRIREAALNWDSIPAYPAMSPDERTRWKRYLANHLDKPVSEVRPRDFEKADGFKYASMVYVSLDAGLRPVEVGRAKTTWADVDNAVLRIPSEESSKNHENWVVSLQEETAEMLRKWLTERRLYQKYTDTETLWLTRHGNPYRSSSLKYVLERLCEEAGIDTENRNLSWYAIRHSVGTYMAREEGLAAAQSQLRHTSSRTTMKYDQAPVEDRRDALNRMG